MLQRLVRTLGEHLDGKLIAGRPIVHIGQEALVELQCRVVVALEPDAKGVHLVLVEEVVGKSPQKRIGILAPCELLGDLAQCRGAHAGHRAGIHGGEQLRIEVLIPKVHVLRQAAAHELACGVLAKAWQLGAQHVFQRRIRGLCQQCVLLPAVNPLEEGLRAHGALLGVEACLGHQVHRGVGFRVLGSCARLMRGQPCGHVGGVAGVEAAVTAFQDVHVVLE